LRHSIRGNKATLVDVEAMANLLQRCCAKFDRLGIRTLVTDYFICFQCRPEVPEDLCSRWSSREQVGQQPDTLAETGLLLLGFLPLRNPETLSDSVPNTFWRHTCFFIYKHNFYKHTEPDFGENLSIC